MKAYKRNQVEDAIVATLGANDDTNVLRRLKRLLDTDRALEVRPQSNQPELANYAFVSGDAPGKGGEIQFSEYESFALLIGLHMLNHRWPQKFVVESLRRIRPALQRQHKKIMRLDPANLFDPDQIPLQAKPGSPALATRSPVFLLIWSDQRTAEDPAPAVEIFEDHSAAFHRGIERPGRSTTWIELTRSAHALSEQLAKTRPRKRGRS
ncbi:MULTISPECIES: hypothetical protein [Bradyrhizobium]|uniref:hypothetical protein n=1 Tax=Bradyrhizobium TaxID=374 RepID=UPI00155F430E|nr:MULTISPECIES: hypothetical protein [Bradyrhizobium]MDD1519220.1 hypothetical protein [Bradyrhizobium sp. WBAH30]MDD1543464.1 hypothetical protein [Bradyrhizobium sp. WBAH41]MDD1557594.1 hypothetical protein [Bradyrhizobium sp. WBAH23]MDD1565006.1 hypothetical protein [Bradyrhizobium sp. WBAH33]MDD1590414.1 hypothetical protein [Bradyrhizobium sp. WBAH42]